MSPLEPGKGPVSPHTVLSVTASAFRRCDGDSPRLPPRGMTDPDLVLRLVVAANGLAPDPLETEIRVGAAHPALADALRSRRLQDEFDFRETRRALEILRHENGRRALKISGDVDPALTKTNTVVADLNAGTSRCSRSATGSTGRSGAARRIRRIRWPTWPGARGSRWR